MNPEKLQQDFDAVRTELQVCKQKMNSKCEALLILTKDLDQCRQERDQFKLMAEQVQARYQSIKRQLAGVGPRTSSLDGVPYSDMKNQSLAHLLCEMRDVNKSLQFEVDDLKQKLRDANGDIKLLREQIARHRVGTTDEGMDTRHFPAHEREDLVHKLETSRDQLNQMERDLQQLLDEKEELVTERDVYRNKYDRLNKELNYILKGDEKRVLDIDNLVMENRYLQERIRQVEDEKVMAMATISKYKTILDRKKNKGILKLGQNRSGGLVISQKQVHQLLDNPMTLSPTPQMMADLQSLASALLETLNDKNVALSHQRKTNKILGARVSELENKLKTLEIAGLWNFPEKCLGLEKLKLDCEEIKLLFPSERPSSKEEDSQPLEHQSDSDSENKVIDPFADGVCQNLVDLDQSNGAISPSHTDRSSCMNSDTEVGTTSTTGAEHIATFLSSCLHHEAKEDDVLGLSELLLTGPVDDHDGVEDTIIIATETESKKGSRNVFEQHGSTIADQPVVESSNADSNNRLCSDHSDEFLASVLNENNLSAEASADGCSHGNSTDSTLLVTS